MKNQEVARLLYDIADLLEIRGEMIFKIRAYRRAAQAVEALPMDVEEAWRQGKLDSIPGVGKGIAEKIDEYLKKGKLKYLDELKKGLPPGFSEMLAIEGIGPKKVKMFYDKLHIKNLEQLEKAARSGKLRKIPKLKEKTEQNILRSIEASKKRGGRMLLGHALLLSDEIINEMKKCRVVERIDAAGSLRRMKETIGDIDILAASNKPKSVIDHFTSMRQVSRVIA
ncbi:MAG: DNA polymerase III, partial [Candidatus Aenigmarchaeota archaeon]|nr:DNA polymerase III [Candidatus Aenigmarchaeota archaeon]